MSSQLNFILHQAMCCLEVGNRSGAELLLKQILKNKSDHADSLQLLAIIYAQQGDGEKALEMIEKSILANRRNGIAYSNKGNILLALERPMEAIDAHKIAIKISPNYAEAYSNLGNVFQAIEDNESAINYYSQAINQDPCNLDFRVNLGNAYSRMREYEVASEIYSKVIEQNPSNASAHFYLAQIKLFLAEFESGWDEYEWRWLSRENNSKPLKTSKPRWQGQAFIGSLYLWAEQGIGDQILHASILKDLRKLPQRKIISVEKKLLPVFRRSFPDFEFIDKTDVLSESRYDQHLPIGSLGKFFRKNKDDFYGAENHYLITDSVARQKIRSSHLSSEKKLCGISWASSNRVLGRQKSVALTDLEKILKLENFQFINLQYGDVASELARVENIFNIKIIDIKDIDLYDDIDGVLGLIDCCDIILTTSNTTAHLAGASGKEVLLLLPFSTGSFWYWHDVDGVSLWYPSIRIFKQEKQGDWSKPIEAAKAYLESRFAI